MENKIKFTDEDGMEVEFTVIEQTKINGKNYLLVAEEDESDEDETIAYILKDVSGEQDAEALYEMVEDDMELDSVSKIFEELLGEDEALV
ncbi:MAG: DUF1292 domain-containing protein [Lachnospiraceae bacterium]|nr:DUF1292 domain-containing protein [Lachnospiraceae bacterium]MBQ4069072.1 DUF1292 domain-containing protein [Lachnospiraceae bacterium]